MKFNFKKILTNLFSLLSLFILSGGECRQHPNDENGIAKKTLLLENNLIKVIN